MSCPDLELDFGTAARLKLLSSPLGGLLPDEGVIDLFCGAGGWTALTEQAIGLRVDAAVNHDEVAIATHQANHPACAHLKGDAWRTRPETVMAAIRAARPDVKRLGLLIASAACKTHSSARGSAPVSKRVHMLGWCIARYAQTLAPRVVVIENVTEWEKWGPVIAKRNDRGVPVRDEQGRAVMVHDPRHTGREFKKFVKFMRSLGYVVEWSVMDAADFGAACRRKRLFMVCRRDGMPICWPEKSAQGAQQERLVDDGGQGRNEHVGCAAYAVRNAEVRRAGEPAADGAEGASNQSAAGHFAAGRAATVNHSAHEPEQEAQGPVDVRQSWQGAPRCTDNGVGGRATCASHSRGSTRGRRCAADVIDWRNLGHSVFITRRQAKASKLKVKRPLADKTLKRVCVGILKHVLEAASPFVLRVTHGEGMGWKVSGIDQPLPTQTTRHDLAVVSPIISPCGGPSREPGPVSAPLNTVLPREDRAVAMPVMHVLRGDVAGVDVRGTLPTITAGNGPGRGAGAAHALAVGTPVMIESAHGGDAKSGDRCRPLSPDQLARGRQVTALMRRCLGKELFSRVQVNRQGLVVCELDGVAFVMIDILFRMLEPSELADAMGFPAGFIWPTAKRDQVRMIGNAVSPLQGLALLRAVLPRGGRTEPEKATQEKGRAA